MPKAPTKPQLQDTLDLVYEKLQEAYDPRLTRKEVVARVGEVLDDLALDDNDVEEEGEEDDDEEED